MTFSASHVWTRISRAIASYGGEFDRNFYEKLIKETPNCVSSIEALQKAGVDFNSDNCWHWSYELCGSFEITHRKYEPPKGSELPEAKPLYNALKRLFGFDEESVKKRKEDALKSFDEIKEGIQKMDILIGDFNSPFRKNLETLVGVSNISLIFKMADAYNTFKRSLEHLESNFEKP